MKESASEVEQLDRLPYTRRFLLGWGEPSLALTTGQTLLGTVQLLPFALGFAHLHVGRPAGAWLGLFCLGVLSSGVAYLLNLHVIAQAGTTIASTVTYLTPVFAVAIAAAFLAESLTWYEPVGGVVVLVGAAISLGRLAQIRQAFSMDQRAEA